MGEKGGKKEGGENLQKNPMRIPRAGTQRKGRLERAVEYGIRTREETAAAAVTLFVKTSEERTDRGRGGGGSASPVHPSIHPAHVVADSSPQCAPSSPLVNLGDKKWREGEREREEAATATASALPCS